MEPVRLTRLVRGELDWIVMKALQKDRSRRYETANSFARDIERYLHDEPVEAGPPSATYRLQKFGRKHRVALSLAAAFAAVLMGAAAISTWRRFEPGGLRRRPCEPMTPRLFNPRGASSNGTVPCRRKPRPSGLKPRRDLYGIVHERACHSAARNPGGLGREVTYCAALDAPSRELARFAEVRTVEAP